MMNKLLNKTLPVFMILGMFCFAFAQDDGESEDLGTDKLAQTGMKFLSFSVDPRAAALGGAITARTGGAMSMFYNPAGMARLNSLSVALGSTQWIADIAYNAVSVAYNASSGGKNLGVFGLSFMSVDYGELQATVRSDSESGYDDVGTFTPTASAIGIGYAFAPTDRFSVGGNVKLAAEKLGEPIMDADGTTEKLDMSTVAFDFGLMYKTDYRNLVLAMTARNFSESLKYAEESFELPLTFRMGVSLDVIENFVLSIDSERPRDYYSTTRIGAEYVLLNMIAVRAGYLFPSDEQGLSVGVGFQPTISSLGLSVDVSYSEFGCV